MTIAELRAELDRSESENLSGECDAFERFLQAELRSWNSIKITDKQWRDGVRAGTIRFDFQFDKEITQRYRQWVLQARICLQQLDLQETKECFPESAASFRKCLEEAEGILLIRTQDEASAMAALEDVE